jgi:hypothetical protein
MPLTKATSLRWNDLSTLPQGTVEVYLLRQRQTSTQIYGLIMFAYELIEIKRMEQ